MRKNVLWRITGILLCASIIAGLCAASGSRSPENRCRSARIISREEAAEYNPEAGGSCDELLSWCGERAAADRKKHRIYLSYKPEGRGSLKDIAENFRIESDALSLFIEADEYAEDIAAAQRDNHMFRVIISDGEGRAEEYALVLTPLPVIALSGDLSMYRDRELNAYSGSALIWDPSHGSTINETAKWNYRGQSSLTSDKKSRKLCFIKRGGETKPRNLLGMGEDDDWILNSLSTDDIKVREKLFQILWNEMAAESDYNYHMSEGKYAELIVNGNYEGLCMLMRKPEPDLLRLKEGDYLIKGIIAPEGSEEKDGYELISEELNLRQGMDIIENAISDGSLNRFMPENFADINLFIDFSGAYDNCRRNNMYYVLHTSEQDAYTSLVPWDTDKSFGLVWIDKLDYNLEAGVSSRWFRMETEAMSEKYPELKKLMSERWFELREGVLSFDNIMKVFGEQTGFLQSTGALQRDIEKWGLQYEGRDSAESFYEYCKIRLSLLDEYYSENNS